MDEKKRIAQSNEMTTAHTDLKPMPLDSVHHYANSDISITFERRTEVNQTEEPNREQYPGESIISTNKCEIIMFIRQ